MRWPESGVLWLDTALELSGAASPGSARVNENHSAAIPMLRPAGALQRLRLSHSGQQGVSDGVSGFVTGDQRDPVAASASEVVIHREAAV